MRLVGFVILRAMSSGKIDYRCARLDIAQHNLERPGGIQIEGTGARNLDLNLGHYEIQAALDFVSRLIASSSWRSESS